MLVKSQVVLRRLAASLVIDFGNMNKYSQSALFLRRKSRALLLKLLLTTSVFFTHRHNVNSQVLFDTHALDLEIAPSVLSEGVEFATFSNPFISNNGRIVFESRLQGTGVDSSNRFAVVDTGGATPAVAVRTGDVFESFDVLEFIKAVENENGHILSSALIDSPDDEVCGLILSSDGIAKVIAAEGATVDGQKGVEFGQIFSITTPVLNARGQAVFLASLVGDGISNENDRAVFRGGCDSINIAVQEGELALGTEFRFGTLFEARSMNDFDQIAFVAELETLAGETVAASGVFSDVSGEISCVVQDGDSAPIGIPDIVFGREAGRTFEAATLNNNGQICFKANLAGPGITPDNDSSIFLYDGELVPVAQAGQAISNSDPDLVYGDWLGEPILNSQRDINFRAEVGQIGSPNSFQEAVVHWSLDGAAVIAKAGEHAPGTGEEVTFGRVLSGDVFSSPSVNANGDVLFFGRLVGPGIDNSNNTGIWNYSSRYGTRLVLRCGDEIAVNPLDKLRTRTVNQIGGFVGAGGEDGRESNLNDLGQMVACVRFDGDSEAILQADVTGPEIVLSVRFLTSDELPLPGIFELSGGNAPSIDSTGKSIFWSNTRAAGQLGQGVFVSDGVSVNSIAVSGEPVPGEAEIYFDSFCRRPSWTQAGQALIEPILVDITGKPNGCHLSVF